MKILNLKIGSPEWLKERGQYRCASDAPAMMKVSDYTKYDDLVQQKATGTVKEFSSYVQERVIDPGHAIEAVAHEIAENIIGETLFPLVGINEDRKLLSSFDGLNLDHTVSWECKRWNEEKAATVRSGNVPETDYWQIVHHFATCPTLDRVIYMVTDGTEARTVYIEVFRSDDDIEMLMDGWRIFDHAVQNFKPEDVKIVPVAKMMDQMPTLVVRATGGIEESNLAVFKRDVSQIIVSINTTLETDEDFVNAKAAAKWCEKVENYIQVSKDVVLSGAKPLQDALAELDELKQQAAQMRIKLDKLVKTENARRKGEIVREYTDMWIAARDKIKAERKLDAWEPQQPNFAAAITNTRSLDGATKALSKALIDAKRELAINADNAAHVLHEVDAQAPEIHALLQPELSKLLSTPLGTAMQIITDRRTAYLAKVDAQKAAEVQRQEEERQRLAQEQEALDVHRQSLAIQEQQPAHIGFDPAAPDEDRTVMVTESQTGVIAVNAPVDDLRRFPELIAIYDTETTGLPDYGQPSESEQQPHLTEIAIGLFTPEGRCVETYHTLIKQGDWECSTEALEVHGITRAMSEYGKDEPVVLAQALDMFAKAGKRVAFNKSFDERIMRIGFSRYFGKEFADQVRDSSTVECAMHLAAARVNPGKKTVKLETAYKAITGRDHTNAHSALADMLAAAEVYFALQRS